MAVTMKDLGIDRLSVAERIALAREIWDSVEADADTPVPTPTSEQARELARRDAEMDANPGIALTWDQIVASIKGGQ